MIKGFNKTLTIILVFAVILIIWIFFIPPLTKSSILNITDNNKVPADSNCQISGCSGELCLESGNGGVASVCLYKKEYVCYKTAKCEKQTTGKCGWTKTPELIGCLKRNQE